MTETVERFQVTPGEEGRRLDAFLAGRLAGITRSRAERLAHTGKVLLNGRPARPGERLRKGDQVEVSLPAAEGRSAHTIAPDIVYEDEHLLIVNKPPGLVVHPGAGGTGPTLVKALLAHTPLPEGYGPLRPGIVHRLDRFTSGLLMVAKTEQAFDHLSRQVREREVERRYLALVWGVMKEDRLLVDIPVGRLLRDPTRIVAAPRAAATRRPVPATTDVSVVERHLRMTLVEASLLTGRTHQIRVHLNHVGHPVVGDPRYGIRRSRVETRALDSSTRSLVKALPGQALHAHSLRFRHPAAEQDLSFSVPPPEAMARLLAHLGRRVI